MMKIQEDSMTETRNFEEILDELKKLVENLEMDEANLENSVKNFEIGMELIKQAEKILTEAQNKIETIELNQK